jgi:hypothetical protein
MGKRLHSTKVLAIRSMLLETDDMYAIAEALNVRYHVVAYHKRKLDRVELNEGIDFKLRVGRMCWKDSYSPAVVASHGRRP